MLTEHTPAVAAAIVEAERLVAAAGGTNLDPIVTALDQRLLAGDVEGSSPVVAQLRRDLMTTLNLRGADDRTGRQLAATLLCNGDARVVVPLLAAQAGGAAALVPTIAVTLFGGLRPPALELASVLAALLVVRGMGPFCRDMGRPLPFEQLGPG